MIPSLRKWVLEHWSSFVIDLSYRRTIRSQDPLFWWGAMEIACHLRAVVLVYVLVSGVEPWYNALLIWSLASTILLMNHVRTLAAHRYRSEGETMTLEGQMLDSIDISACDLITLILCPVGLRFHAMHHMFPGMPYHNGASTAARSVAHRSPVPPIGLSLALGSYRRARSRNARREGTGIMCDLDQVAASQAGSLNDRPGTRFNGSTDVRNCRWAREGD
jgi:fatty acid desaturase